MITRMSRNKTVGQVTRRLFKIDKVIEQQAFYKEKIQQMHPIITINNHPVLHNHSPPTHYYPPVQLQQNQPSSPTLHQSNQYPIQQSSPSTPTPSKFVNSYVIDYNRKLGKGNFSHVYVAIDQRQPNVKLAVKVVDVQVLRQQNIEYLIKTEVEILMAMRHQNILYCKDVFWDQNFCYIFTQFCEGGTLEAKIKKSQQNNSMTLQRSYSNHFQNNVPTLVQHTFYVKTENQNPASLPNLTERQMLPIIKDVFQGMLYLERNFIIHRDLKAANILLKENKAIIADFGFARYVREPFNDLSIGSLPFMAPQILTKLYYTNKADVWAFGVLLYEIFHGESPYAKSHDMNQLTQKVYTPLTINSIRNDLSTEMKQFILSCLEIDFERRMKFSQLQRTWFYAKLFCNIGQYNYGYNVNRFKTVVSMNNNINGISNNLSPTLSFDNKNLLTVGQIGNKNGRSFGSRFKQKVNIGSSSKNMNYSSDSSQSKQNNKKNQKIINQVQAFKIQDNNNNNSPQISKTSSYTQNKQRSNSPTANKINVYKINFTVSSPNKQDRPIQQITSPINQQNIYVNQIQPQYQSPQHIPINLNGNSNGNSNLEIKSFPNVNINQQISQNIINNNQIGNLENKGQKKQSQITSEPQQKISFKTILLRIQQIRNYYKLAILLKDRNQRITQIKNRLFIKAVKQMRKIQRMINKDQINLGAYDKNKQKKGQGQQKKQQNIINLANRKAKLTSIIKDYKIQFENQLKRRDINVINMNNDNLGNSGFFFSKGIQIQGIKNTSGISTIDEQNYANKNINSLNNNINNINTNKNKYTVSKGDTIINFKGKTPSLSQDIQYIVQTQLLYHAQDTVNMSYQQCQAYRMKVKQILQDIMHVEHGYLNVQNNSILSSKSSKDNLYINNQPLSQTNVKILKNILSQNIQPIPYNNPMPISYPTIQNINSSIPMQIQMQRNTSTNNINTNINTNISQDNVDEMELLSRIKLKQKSVYQY